jgi:cytochrome c-type biogenesis protein CcmE
MDSMKQPNLKIIIGAVVIVAALAYLLISSTLSQSQYFMTVEELQAAQAEWLGKDVRMSGVVLGDTIQYDPQTLELTFEVAQIPGDHRQIEAMGGMQKVLEAAASDPSAARMTIRYHGVRPDLLKDEAQAIITGSLQANGEFRATELLLKCPSKYEAALPDQSE